MAEIKSTASVQDEVPCDGAAFRTAMRQLAGGTSVISVGFGEDRSGLTVTSVSSLSVDPPTLVFCINITASCWPILQRDRVFGVNVLASDQRAVADRFAGRDGVRGADRYAGAEWSTLITGAPLLDGAIAVLDCWAEEIIERHASAIVIGAVKAVRVAGEGDAPAALTYWRGAYGALGRSREPG